MTRNERLDLRDAGSNELTNALAVPASLELDTAKYAGDLDDFDMTDAQKQELLGTLWSIMRSFVDLGFNVDICAHLFEDFNGAAQKRSDDVKFPITPSMEMPASGNGKDSAE